MPEDRPSLPDLLGSFLRSDEEVEMADLRSENLELKRQLAYLQQLAMFLDENQPVAR